MYETLTYTGGVHKHEEIKELIEDLGGFVLQETTSQMDLVLTLAVPVEDVDKVDEKSRELLGKIKRAPMAGTEIAIVSPTLARQHLPHSACDISEYLRRYGAKDNMIGLSRGAGKGISRISEDEKRLIEEHDLVVFALGSFRECLMNKTHLFNDIDIPVVVTGAPEMSLDDLPGATAYVNGLGRIPRRLKRGENIRALRNLAEVVEDILDNRRKEMMDDPPIVPSILVKTEIENQVKAVEEIYSPAPIVSQLDGVRVKLNYDEHKDEIAEVKVDEYRLGDVSEIKKSLMYDYILVKLLPESSII
ncbi:MULTISPECIES: methanogenesis marker 7 protein [Methanobacterium]|jgi:putative methanogenesis marker protein 7|uniref:Methanogenesis marker protein 7 n=1 Tax=Methanobacterium formicicum TaxID=2162 RepID=A0A089ZCI8_METFO|nr:MULTISPECIES: methanogenesis marker 7 protein [Methanobacterium]AIS31767.1 methanogenesis marker protein 7 [Methanobacterium formicicum]KUK75726.1 MAG: Methanogenesis marker protein 7 [Methanobacterium sp. 42_16]MDD4810843.1 methanogenesis marker 7 protein [Methanobacterium formicicum]MDG3548215.1 methanogenesis marker 7 protein [Methanobacterium formicicum]MDH2659879.1 methanogenesis marker 7 protein [Methanobacterium formicicum]